MTDDHYRDKLRAGAALAVKQYSIERMASLFAQGVRDALSSSD
jgi:hypothetical protein